MTFAEAKGIVERVHREIGWPRCYTLTDYQRDRRLAIKSSTRKREKQRMEAEQSRSSNPGSMVRG